jgi:hypothetical protein
MREKKLKLHQKSFKVKKKNQNFIQIIFKILKFSILVF